MLDTHKGLWVNLYFLTLLLLLWWTQWYSITSVLGREKGSSQGREKRKNTRRYLFLSPPISSSPNNKTKEQKKEEAALEQDHRAVVVFYPTIRDLAAHLSNTYPEKFRLGTISWGFFLDGWPDIKFEHITFLEGREKEWREWEAGLYLF